MIRTDSPPPGRNQYQPNVRDYEEPPFLHNGLYRRTSQQTIPTQEALPSQSIPGEFQKNLLKSPRGPPDGNYSPAPKSPLPPQQKASLDMNKTLINSTFRDIRGLRYDPYKCPPHPVEIRLHEVDSSERNSHSSAIRTSFGKPSSSLSLLLHAEQPASSLNLLLSHLLRTDLPLSVHLLRVSQIHEFDHQSEP